MKSATPLPVEEKKIKRERNQRVEEISRRIAVMQRISDTESSNSESSSSESSDSESSSERALKEGRYRDAYESVREELANTKDDYLSELDHVLELERTLAIADGKVMMMATVLHNSFNAIMQLNSGLDSNAAAAKRFLKEHKGGTVDKTLDVFKAEADGDLQCIGQELE